MRYTEEELTRLRSMPKQVTNPGARWTEKPKDKPVHRQRGYRAVSQQDSAMVFLIYQRQCIEDETDFSCGISYNPKGSQPLTLARYNGPGHIHGDIIIVHISTLRLKGLLTQAVSQSQRRRKLIDMIPWMVPSLVWQMIFS